MTTIAYAPVNIQTSAESAPAIPAWFGEITLLAHYLTRQKILERISEQVRFARRRFGRYEVIDFLAVLFGYTISGERTLEAFYQTVLPWSEPFMALFNREKLPSRSALSRFLAVFPLEAVEALRALFVEDLLARPLAQEQQRGELLDRAGGQWEVFDIDGTRVAARQRALPKTEDLPAAQRRLDEVCAAGYTGRKRGEVIRTRTVVSQAHSSQWLGSFGNRGNGEYRKELAYALGVIRRYLAALGLPQTRALLRLDGLYGTGAVIADLDDLCFVMRGKDYAVLDHPTVQARLHLPPDAHFSRPESTLVRTLYDCPDVPVGKTGCRCRVVVATHPAAEKKSRIGRPRKGVVYELFFTQLPQDGFTASDVVALYLHRGAFEAVLSDEDREIDPDRWCSHAPAGQEAFQIIAQWVWNLRLELGHMLEPTPLRTTEFAPPMKESTVEQVPVQGYGTPSVALPWKAGRFSGQDFSLQPDGTLRCPAQQSLVVHERRKEADGSLRVVYAASIRSCRPCPLREQCQWQGSATKKPRQVSVLLRFHRRACIQLLRHQYIKVEVEPPTSASLAVKPVPLSRAQRAHYRLSWAERLARNARPLTAGQVTIRLFGIPEGFAISLGLATA